MLTNSADSIEFELIMKKNIKEFSEKAKLKEEKYKELKQKISDSSEVFDSFPPEEKFGIDVHDSCEETPPLTLKSQFLKNLDSKESLDKGENEYIIKNLNTGESYDIRNQELIDNLTSKTKQLTEVNKEKAWQDYWYVSL